MGLGDAGERQAGARIRVTAGGRFRTADPAWVNTPAAYGAAGGRPHPFVDLEMGLGGSQEARVRKAVVRRPRNTVR